MSSEIGPGTCVRLKDFIKNQHFNGRPALVKKLLNDDTTEKYRVSMTHNEKDLAITRANITVLGECKNKIFSSSSIAFLHICSFHLKWYFLQG